MPPNGTATVADSDYVANSNTLHFAANENTQTISVTINGDTKVEANETFNVLLSGATNGATISDSPGRRHDHQRRCAAVAGSVSINDVTIVEGNSGTKVATFTVTRSGGTAAFNVNFATSDGTATVADSDYVANSNTLHFAANENTQTISVTINGDTKVEANETFNVNLSGATNGATISDSQGVGTITNDDVGGGCGLGLDQRRHDRRGQQRHEGGDLHGYPQRRHGGIRRQLCHFRRERHGCRQRLRRELQHPALRRRRQHQDGLGHDQRRHQGRGERDFQRQPVGPTNGATISDSQGVGTITNDDVAAPTKADLTVSSITAAASVGQGGKLDLSYVVSNLGGTAAGAHSAGITSMPRSMIPTSWRRIPSMPSPPTRKAR